MADLFEPHDQGQASTPDKTVLTVSQLNRQARITIERQFSQVWVMGEMSNFARPRSGHWYFSLKDDNAQVRCAMFANRNRLVSLQPGDGQLVIARGRVSLYEGRGDFQVIVDHLEPAGEGALRQAFDQLKAKLAGEGLFEQARKRQLPAIPQHVAVITSPTGAAVKDVLAVWRRRFPALEVTILPSSVQGPAAEAQLLRAIERGRKLQPDVLLITRGGGSLEDLWSFNLESVARALADCECVTVSAIGHEIDVTITDFVADLRAPTPSAAAELITPDIQALHNRFVEQQRHLQMLWERHHEYLALRVANLRLQIPSPQQMLERTSQRVDDATSRFTQATNHTIKYHRLRLQGLQKQLHSSRPSEQLHRAQLRVADLTRRMQSSLTQQLAAHEVRLANTSRMLNTVSPLPTLGRGFAIITDSDDQVITTSAGVEAGQQIRALLADGRIEAEVIDSHPGKTIGSE